MTNLNKGEIIQVHIGQTGVQMALACWELYCLEHNIDANGCIGTNECISNPLFSSLPDGKVLPRVIMVDSEPEVIEQIRLSAYRNLFHPSSMISGKNDSGNNFSRGYYEIHRELTDITMDTIRSTAEACSNLKGFIIFRSFGGGTGSGLGTRIFEKLYRDYEKSSKFEFVIFPTERLSSVIIEPYNAILAAHANMDFCDCTFLMDNEALSDICTNRLDLVYPTFTNFNRVVAQAISTFSTPLRFPTEIDLSFHDLQKSLIPYPRIHFSTMSYSPIISSCAKCNENCLTINRLTCSVFDQQNQFLKYNSKHGKYVSCLLLYRGNLSSMDINYSVNHHRIKNQNFIDWSPIGIQSINNYMEPKNIPWNDLQTFNKDLCMMSTNSQIKSVWNTLLNKFNKMYKLKTYLYHFICEGLEQLVFDDAKENIATLIEDYKEIEKESKRIEEPLN